MNKKIEHERYKSKLPKDLNTIAHALDRKFKLPFNIKIGLDGLIGLVPVVGDTLSFLISNYILLRAFKLNCSKLVLLRIFVNNLFDLILGLIPFIGDFFDVINKSNIKNIELIRKNLEDSSFARNESLLVLLVYIILLLGPLTIIFFSLYRVGQYLL